MRYVAALWLSAMWMCGACDGEQTPIASHTVVIVDADSGLRRLSAKLHVRIENDGEQRFDETYEEDLWPQRYVLEPRGGDAKRSFELLAEAFGEDDSLLGSQRLKTGFVSGETRYARLQLRRCPTPSADERDPRYLESNEKLASAVFGMCQETAGSGGSAGTSEMIVDPSAGETGSGGAGGMEGLASAGAGGEAGAGAGGAGAGGMGGGAGGGGAGGMAGAQACGDGRVSDNELCDTAIEAGKQGACPGQCDAQDVCTSGKLTGSACQARCEYMKITGAARDDGCCPPGISANADNDCKSSCGNGVVESGETCDQPESCTAAMLCGSAPACTTAVLKGDPSLCTATCSLQPIQSCATGDGCCPSGCSRPADQDCPVACGDGNVDSSAGETCEPSSATQACPKSCDDGDVCTTDGSTGSASTCNLVCFHTRIQAAINSDGCCPPRANANNDNDCKATCGNGVVESGERCDGNCPSEAGACNDNDPCTRDALSGSGCQARCTHTTVSASQMPDGCCPPGATSASDLDCGGGSNMNLLAGKVFTSSLPASSDEPGHPVRNMTDNDDATRFISEPESPITLIADLGAVVTLTRVEIVWAGDTIQNFTLAMSNDQQSWTTIVTGKTRNGNVESETYTTFSATPMGRYFRISGKDRWNPGYGNSVYEVRLYGR